MVIHYDTYNGKDYCNVYVDKSSSNGLLRFSHEINIEFVKLNNEWKFNSAWHCGVSEMEWDSTEEDSFEQTFPDLLTEIRKNIAA